MWTVFLKSTILKECFAKIVKKVILLLNCSVYCLHIEYQTKPRADLRSRHFLKATEQVRLLPGLVV